MADQPAAKPAAAGAHADRRFPRAQSSYACPACQASDHVHCAVKRHWPGYEETCECWSASQPAHLQLIRLEQEAYVADLIQPVLEQAGVPAIVLSSAIATRLLDDPKLSVIFGRTVP